MNKKWISLVLANIMLIELCGVNVFAEDRGQEFTGKTKKVASSYGKYCEEVPRNAYNMPTDVECAIEEELSRFKYRGKSLSKIKKVGENADITVVLSKYSGLLELVRIFDDWLRTEHKEATKHQFISSFSDGTKKLFGINDEESVNRRALRCCVRLLPSNRLKPTVIPAFSPQLSRMRVEDKPYLLKV